MSQTSVGDRIVDIIEEHLRHAGPFFGKACAPVGDPPIVGADADQAELVVLRQGGPGNERAGREERRDRVGEHDLAHDPIGVELGPSALVIPVAGLAIVLQVAEGVLVGAAPLRESVLVLRLEVLAIRLHIRGQHDSPTRSRCSDPERSFCCLLLIAPTLTPPDPTGVLRTSGSLPLLSGTLGAAHASRLPQVSAAAILAVNRRRWCASDRRRIACDH